MTDAIAAVREFLLADSSLAAKVSTRVFGGELPKAEITSMPRTAVVLKRAGGGLLGTGYQEYGDVRVDVACYGETPLDADEVFRLAHDALKQMTRCVYADTLLHWASASNEGASGRDPDTDWPVCLSSWQVLASEVAAA